MLSRRHFLITSLGAAGLGAGCGLAAQPAPAVRPDLYNCEGCEAASERAPETLSPRATIARPDEPGQRLILRGTVYQPDGITPAKDVVIYAHHTNDEGLYAGGTNETTWARRHGRLRGWARSGPDGQFEFDTIKPAPYPSRTMPAHIHLYLKEPGHPPYYIDDVVFDGEFKVDAAYRRSAEGRGGSGIVRLDETEDGILVAIRDIILERHPG